ncbi:MAG TPA: tetratricopeptide repeat protein, partial [Phycisphaerae bacterium]|nr:tetratricopeptide repeat protein [Phycisphaerae bacterium]
MRDDRDALASARTKQTWLFLLRATGLVLIVLAAFYPLRSAGFIWDDKSWLLTNPLVRYWAGIPYFWLQPGLDIQYYPLVYTVFDVAYHLWGYNPLGYHLMNVLFQAGNTLLVWILLQRLGLKSAWLAAAIFAVHPIQVETVGWITEIKSLLSVFFYLLTLLFYCRFSGLDQVSLDANSVHAYRRFPLYFLAFFFYLLALFSKTDVCTLPAAILILIWWKRGHWMRSDILWLLPMFVIGAILALMTIHVEHTTAGTSGPDWDFAFSQRTIIAGKALWFYAAKIFFPDKLFLVYPRWSTSELGGWEWIFPISIVFILAVLWITRKKIGRGPFSAAVFFLITLAPVLGFISYFTMLYTFVADHYQYLACLGLIVPAAEFLWWLAHVLPIRQNQLFVLAGSIIVLALSVLTFGQSLLYQSPVSLWGYVDNANPNSFIVKTSYAEALLEAQDVSDALPLLNQADQLRPGNIYTHLDLGMAYMQIGEYQTALGYFRTCLIPDPSFNQAWCNAANCLVALGRYTQAIGLLQDAVKANPANADAWFGLARLYEA